MQRPKLSGRLWPRRVSPCIPLLAWATLLCRRVLCTCMPDMRACTASWQPRAHALRPECSQVLQGVSCCAHDFVQQQSASQEEGALITSHAADAGGSSAYLPAQPSACSCALQAQIQHRPHLELVRSHCWVGNKTDERCNGHVVDVRFSHMPRAPGSMCAGSPCRDLPAPLLVSCDAPPPLLQQTAMLPVFAEAHAPTSQLVVLSSGPASAKRMQPR